MNYIKSLLVYCFVLIFPLPIHSQSKSVPLDAVNVEISLESKGPNNTRTFSPIGSGFFFTGNKWIYLVTAKHVINDLIKQDARILVAYDSIPVTQKSTVTISLSIVNLGKTIFVSETNDVAICTFVRLEKLDQAVWPRNVGLHEYIAKPGYKVGAGSMAVTGKDFMLLFDDIQITDDVILSGFPSSLDNYTGLSNENYSTDIPLFRRGMIANKNHKTRKLIIDGMVFPGNSGGPVMIGRIAANGQKKYSIAGVLIQNIPYNSISKNERGIPTNLDIQNSGYSIAEPMDAVIKLVSLAESIAL